MVTLSISFSDLVTILAACRTARAADCAPDPLRARIVKRLAGPSPRLAAIVRRFDQAQMAALARYALEGIALSEGPPTVVGP
ncbi:MAG: hypothetical protein J2P46_21170 [Zavarzinella sp.]|nr:hypothetical protein [Zavarzinella sp.]